MSSAYWWISIPRPAATLATGAMYSENSNGPSTDPCGTPRDYFGVSRSTASKLNKTGAIRQVGLKPTGGAAPYAEGISHALHKNRVIDRVEGGRDIEGDEAGEVLGVHVLEDIIGDLQ